MLAFPDCENCKPTYLDTNAIDHGTDPPSLPPSLLSFSLSSDLFFQLPITVSVPVAPNTSLSFVTRLEQHLLVVKRNNL